MATAEGTAKFLRRAVQRGALHHLNSRTLLAPSQPVLSVSALGFGAYRVGGSDQEKLHLDSIRSAIRAGVNLIDTSTHYADGCGIHGASEKLVGKAVAEAVSTGDAAREEIVICTKVGHAPVGEPQPVGGVRCAPAESGNNVWHSIHPEFVESEVRQSRERLGTSPDFVLLHNPEYYLSSEMSRRTPIGDAWEVMYQKLVDSFEMFEALCDDGVIEHGYGVSANFLSCVFSVSGRPNLYEALALDRVVDAATAAAARRGKKEHRFRIAQLPLNAVENGAVLGRGNAVAEAAEGDCSLAVKFGVAVVGNRPLNALPLPGVSAGDWGRRGPTHLQLRDSKPMGAVESLLRRVIMEHVSDPEACVEHPQNLQQLALRLVASSPGVTCCLSGMRSDSYVQDASSVLQAAPIPADKVREAMKAVRIAATELGCENRGLW